MRKTGFFSRMIRKIFLKAFSLSFITNTNNDNIYLKRTSFNYENAVGMGERSSVFVAVLLWICRRFAEAKYQLKKEDEEVKQHGLLDLLNKPNRFFSGRLIRMFAAWNYHVDGNVYFLILRNKQLKPVELWPVPYYMMEPRWPIYDPNNTTFISHYDYTPSGTPIKILPEDVLHIRNGIDPDNLRKGLSQAKILLREIFTDDEAANFTAAMLKNAGIPGLVISPEKGIAANQEDVNAVKLYIKQMLSGDGRGQPWILSAPTKVEQFGFTPAQMNLEALRNIPEERVTAVLGVPAAVVGFGTGLETTKVGATMSVMRESAYEDCIIPMQNIYCEEIFNRLMPEFDTRPDLYELGFDLSNVRVLQEDEDKKAARNRDDYKAGIITRAEARISRGYEADPDDEVYAVPANIILLSPDGQMPAVNNTEGKMHNAEVKGRISGSKRTQLIRAFDIAVIKGSRKFASALYKRFVKLGDDAAEAWEKIVEENGIEELKDLPNVEKKTDDDLYKYFAEVIANEIDTNNTPYGPHYIAITKATYEAINNILGLGVDLTEPEEFRILELGGMHQGLVDLTQEVKDNVFEAIKEARELGEGPIEAARRIRDYVGTGRWNSKTYRSKLVARAESKYCQNKASLGAYKQGGVESIEIVDAQLGDIHDPVCIERNGTVVPIAEAENVELSHPNCSLSFTPVFPE